MVRKSTDEIDARLRALGVDLDDGDDDLERSWPLTYERKYSHSDGGESDNPPIKRDTSARALRRETERPSYLPPLCEPAGYRRDRRGTWRYVHSGRPVPGARDITLDSLYRYGSSDPVVVPLDEARSNPELEWCLDFGNPTEGLRRVGSRIEHFAALCLTIGEWRDHSRWPLGIDAPELSASQLLDVATVARIAGGLQPSSITADLARGRLPAPQVRIGGRPAWSRPIIIDALRGRG